MGVGCLPEGEEVDDFHVGQFSGVVGHGPDEIEGCGAAGADEDPLSGLDMGDRLPGGHDLGGIPLAPVLVGLCFFCGCPLLHLSNPVWIE